MMNRLFLVAIGLSSPWALGCGGKVVFAEGDGGAGGSTSIVAGNTTGVSTVSTATGTTSTCSKDSQCQTGFVCVHSDGLCGKGVPGKCTKEVTPSCPLLPPGCLCSGTVTHGCSPADYSVDPSVCSHGTFACGGLQCKNYLEYCLETGGSPQPSGGGGDTFNCVPATPSCSGGIIDCNCLTDDVAGSCTEDGTGGVTLVTGPIE